MSLRAGLPAQLFVMERIMFQKTMIKILAATLIGLAAGVAPQVSYANPVTETRPGQCSGNYCIVEQCSGNTCEIWRNYYSWNYTTNSWDLSYSTYEVRNRHHLQQ